MVLNFIYLFLELLLMSLLTLKVIYHPLYSMNNFVTNKSKLPQMGHKCFLIWGDWLSCDPPISEGHMIAKQPHIWGDWLSCDPLGYHVTP